jgi:hypothetical protein
MITIPFYGCFLVLVESCYKWDQVSRETHL